DPLAQPDPRGHVRFRARKTSRPGRCGRWFRRGSRSGGRDLLRSPWARAATGARAPPRDVPVGADLGRNTCVRRVGASMVVVVGLMLTTGACDRADEI